MAGTKISELTPITTVASADYFPVVQDSDTSNKRVSLSSLLANVPAGSASSPSLAFNGDSNTGIYSPGADQLALSTNGAGRLFVDASGNVGVGSSSSDSTTLRLVPTNTDAIQRALHIGYNGSMSSGVNGTYISFGNTTPSTLQLARIASFYEGGAYSGSLRFYTNTASDGANPTEKMRITHAGLVGIGTSSPSALLHVSSTGAVESLLSGGGTSGDTVLHLKGNGNAYKFIVPNAAAQYGMGLYDVGNAAYRLYVNGSGNVGIGTTSPGGQLDVSGTSDTRVITRESGNSVRTDLMSQTTQGGVGTTSNHPFFIQTNGSERCRVDTSGRLLVGTSSAPADSTFVVKSVYGANQPANVYLTSYDTAPSAAGSLGVIKFSDSGQTTAAQIQCSRDGGTWTSGSSQPTRLVFSTTADGASSPTERMRIDSSGRLLVGGTNTAPGSGNNSVGHAFIAEGTAYHSRTSSQALVLNRTSTTGVIAYLNYNGSAVGNISVTASSTAYNTSSDYRLKENVTPVTDGITRLQQLKPSRFNFIADPDKTVDGFLAHEVQTIVPEAITGEKDAVDDEGNPQYQGIDQSKLVPLLTAALQEAVAKIESLEARLTAAGI